MLKKITVPEWEAIEEALMKAEIPYKVSFDSHLNSSGVLYDKLIEITPFAVIRFVDREK